MLMDEGRVRTMAKTETETGTEYAVFGPGHGSQYLDAATHLGSGHLAYRGPSLARARRVLAQMRASVRQLRKQPDMRHVTDTYRIYYVCDRCWRVMSGE
jgi:hypothetical protein